MPIDQPSIRWGSSLAGARHSQRSFPVRASRHIISPSVCRQPPIKIFPPTIGRGGVNGLTEFAAPFHVLGRAQPDFAGARVLLSRHERLGQIFLRRDHVLAIRPAPLRPVGGRSHAWRTAGPGRCRAPKLPCHPAAIPRLLLSRKRESGTPGKSGQLRDVEISSVPFFRPQTAERGFSQAGRSMTDPPARADCRLASKTCCVFSVSSPQESIRAGPRAPARRSGGTCGFPGRFPRRCYTRGPRTAACVLPC